MKKNIILIISFAMVLVLVGCGSSDEPIEELVFTNNADEIIDDNIVKNEESGIVHYYKETEETTNGWISTVSYEVYENDVISANFDGYYKEGSDYPYGISKKEAVATGDYDIQSVGAKASWTEEISWVEKYFIENDSLAGIMFNQEGKEADVVTGATIYYDMYADLVK